MSRTLRPLVFLVLSLVAIACATVPYTGRSQLLFTPEVQELQLGAEMYQKVLQEERVVTDPRIVDPVIEVGRRIAAVSNRPDYDWEFNVIDKPDVANASVLPGGKVLVFSGLYPVARDTGGLAAVMAHEVGHAIARHGGERMSQMTLLQGLQVGLAVAFNDAANTTKQMVFGAYGLGAQFGVMLPFGRSQESEADHIGMLLMAKAGYDPAAALALWERFEQTGKDQPPEFLSTHPSYATRQSNIRSWLPEARQHFQPSAEARIYTLPAVTDSGAAR